MSQLNLSEKHEPVSGPLLTQVFCLGPQAQIQVTEVKTRRDKKHFIRFPNQLYALCPHYVPPLTLDELELFAFDKNPLYETADAQLFLAWDGSEVVGRIAGIISHAANEKTGACQVRFAWFDAVNDFRVAKGLFGAVEEWGRGLGATKLTGPHGFNEFEKEGMMVSGFNTTPTMASYYNHPYYNDLAAQLGFEKEVDFVEYRIRGLQNPLPPQLSELAARVKARKAYKILRFKRRKDLLKWADPVLALVEETYADLYDSVPLTDTQKTYYRKKFFPYLRPELVIAATDQDDELIGFIIAMPSLSGALKKAKGRLFPFGIYHLWKATRPGNKVLDFCLAGIRRSHRGRGVDVAMGEALFDAARQMGFEEAETNLELEDNLAVRNEWKPFDHELVRRRRIYTKAL